jgi:hypothetical protein
MMANDPAQDTPYLLTQFEGGHGADVNNLTIEQYNQDGTLWVGNAARERTISISGIIRGSFVAAPRIKMLETIHPKHALWLRLERPGQGFARRIRCYADRAPYFTAARGDRFTMKLLCPGVFWENDGDGLERVGLTGFYGNSEWPLEFVEGGIELGISAPNASTLVYNPGDVPVGLEITWTAAYALTNPTVLNNATGEHITFGATLDSGDKLTVITRMGEKEAVIRRADRSTKNAMRYIDVTSSFLQIQPGDNILRADCETGEEFLSCAVTFRPLYLGV